MPARPALLRCGRGPRIEVPLGGRKRPARILVGATALTRVGPAFIVVDDGPVTLEDPPDPKPTPRTEQGR